MKELTISKKNQVIKLLLEGYAYDDIVKQAGVAKGSVVNIVDEFRNGILAVPPGMTGYIDELRRLVVDLKKQQTTVAQVKSCLKIQAKLQDMGVGGEQAEQWLEMCQEIASPAVSNSEFVAVALELAQVELENGLSYKSLAEDYGNKLKLSEGLGIEIEEKKVEKQKVAKELESMTKAMVTAGDTFKKQREGMKSQLNECIAQHQLSWEKVNTVVAMLNSELNKEGLTSAEIGGLAEQVRTAGSLFASIKQLESERDGLKSEVEKLAKGKATYESSVDHLEHVNQGLCNSIYEKGCQIDALDAEIQSKQTCLGQLKEETMGMFHDIKIASLLMALLILPDIVSDANLDQLVRLMIAIRARRLGEIAGESADSEGNPLVICPMPKIMSDLNAYDIDINDIKSKLVAYIMPIVQDRFVTREEYQEAEIKHRMDLLEAKYRALGAS